jgi:hypothetical protein
MTVYTKSKKEKAALMAFNLGLLALTPVWLILERIERGCKV